MPQLTTIIGFIVRSTVLGLVVAAMVLLLVPDLRIGAGLQGDWFSNREEQPSRLTYYEALSVAAPAVVNIYSAGIEYSNRPFSRSVPQERTNLGSGVIMNDNGYILTCYHVVENADTIFISVPDGRRVEAEMVGYDRFTDLAVIKVNADNLHVIPQLEEPNTRVGDVVLAIGNPYNLGQTITQGIVSRTGRNGLANYVDYIQTDAVLNQGNSGGALVDSNGTLVGITNASFLVRDNQRGVRSVDGVNFAVPYTLAKRVMDEIIASGKVIRGALGFEGSQLVNSNGILVTRIHSGSPAALGGLQIDDILIAIDGVEIENASTALDTIAETPPGTIMQLEVFREQQRIAMQVVVGELQGS